VIVHLAAGLQLEVLSKAHGVSAFSAMRCVIPAEVEGSLVGRRFMLAYSNHEDGHVA
jgi:hypothetical protein